MQLLTGLPSAHPLTAASRLVDVGSGVGKLLIAAALLTPARARGVEYVAERAARAARSATYSTPRARAGVSSAAAISSLPTPLPTSTSRDAAVSGCAEGRPVSSCTRSRDGTRTFRRCSASKRTLWWVCTASHHRGPRQVLERLVACPMLWLSNACTLLHCAGRRCAWHVQRNDTLT